MKFSTRLKTAYLLGPMNIGHVLHYRFKKRFFFKRHAVTTDIPQPPFFQPVHKQVHLPTSQNWQHQAWYFGWWSIPISSNPPDWFHSPESGIRVTAEKPWWCIADFNAEVGDIKCIWEASRFAWLIPFSQRALTGNATALEQLNHWLADWCKKNPPSMGPNWKCGQEAAIRVMHLAMASLLLGQSHAPTQGLMDLIRTHVARIALTLRYAMSQDNNHSTSEAAALFIGGSWLAASGYIEGIKWQRQGQYWLENRVKRLIEKDGSFSQYSTNYHRVMLDTITMVELWRRAFNFPAFSKFYYTKACAAVHWLYTMVDETTGDVPNLGANDGARLFPLTDNDRDFRPSVQLAMALFENKRAYSNEGDWNLPFAWLNMRLPDGVCPAPRSQLFNEGGYAVLRLSQSMVCMRYPRFHFRPSQADVLHVDLWKDGCNLLRDAGSYSYHTEHKIIDYFSGTKGHNTIQFDSRDHMPRLSRFLFGDWLTTASITPLHRTSDSASFLAAYKDNKGVLHSRQVSLNKAGLTVIDEIDHFKSKAVLRWRLLPGEWFITGNALSNGVHQLTISASMPIKRFELVAGWESRYYMKKTETPVIEVEVDTPGQIVSVYSWVVHPH